MGDVEHLFWQSADGLKLHARDYRPEPQAWNGRTVVCIPGLTRNATDFDSIARQILATGWRVIAVDLRGRAGSDRARDPQSYNPRTYASGMLALLDSQGIERAVFIGTSLGVLVTMTVAARAPERIAAAVLNDAGPEVPREALVRIGRYAGKTVPPMTLEHAVAYVSAIGKPAFPRYGDAEWRDMTSRMFRVRDDGLLELDYDPAIVRTVRPWLLWLLRPVLWRMWRALARCGPMLVVRGALSDILAADVARRMLANAKDAVLAEVPDVGHAPFLGEPEARDAILALLRRAP